MKVNSSVYKVHVKFYLKDIEGEPPSQTLGEEIFVLADSIEEAVFKGDQYAQDDWNDKFTEYEVVLVQEFLRVFLGLEYSGQESDAIEEYEIPEGLPIQ